MHLMDVDINILIENAVFCILCKDIQKDADLIEAIQDKKRRYYGPVYSYFTDRKGDLRTYYGPQSP